MRRNVEDLDFHQAFTPMPESCHRALMDAARSVKEEKPVKRATYRAVLIAAVLIVVTMAVAFAAQQLGWVDFFKGYYGVAVPKSGEALLKATQPITYQVGPMTFTYQQLLADGRIALSTAAVHTTDGSAVLYAADSNIYDAVDAMSDTIRDLYHLTSGTTWVQAAQQLKLPLYGIRALIEVDEPYCGGEAMEDALWSEDGSIVYFNMPATNPDTVKDSLPVTLYMAVREYDPTTGEELNQWIMKEKADIPVAGMTAEKTYHSQSAVTFRGMTFNGMRAEQYATGVYLFTSFTAPEGMEEDAAVDAVYSLSFCDLEGNEIPGGINLSASANTSGWPTVVLESMVSMDALPDQWILTDGEVEIPVQ